VITGAEDPVAPPDAGAALAQAIMGARHVVVADAAHIANAERPSAFTQALIDHLQGSDEEGA
jgi:3-oxoadipate enol-lactonase